jgi:hypothetical protein
LITLYEAQKEYIGVNMEEWYLLSRLGWKEIHVAAHDTKHETGCSKTSGA